MKYIILSFLMLLTQAVSAQTIRDSQNQSDSLSIGEIFYLGEQNDAQKATIKIKTNETTTQRHDGNDVFKTNRVVEYSIKKTSANIVISRKIISTVDTPLSTETTIKKLFPNVTSKLLSGILKPGKRNIAEWELKKIPCSISSKNGLVAFLIDKLVLAGGNIEEKNMGTITKFNNMTETLLCKEKSEQPCLDNIKSIITSTALTSTNKLKGSHHIELEEVINIEDKAIVKK
nr:hypothetical protein [Prevotella sp.]